MEDRVRRLEIANAQLAISVEHLATSVKALTETVQVLRDTMNQGRGMTWALMGASGAIGGAITVFLKHILSTVR